MPTDLSPAFLADICAYPYDDTPRLIYADWLEDHGQPERAEFIRVGLAYAHREPGDQGFLLLEREAKLLQQHGEKWHPAAWGHDEVLFLLKSPHGIGTTSYCIGDDSTQCAACFWYRGFVHRVHCDCQQWRDHGPVLALAEPITTMHLQAPMLLTNEPHADMRRFLWTIRSRDGSWPWDCSYVCETEKEAISLWCQQALAWAREQAGLPPL